MDNGRNLPLLPTYTKLPWREVSHPVTPCFMQELTLAASRCDSISWQPWGMGLLLLLLRATQL